MKLSFTSLQERCKSVVGPARSFGSTTSWFEDGSIIAALNGTGGLSRIPAVGGAPVLNTELDRQHGEITAADRPPSNPVTLLVRI